MEPDLLEQCVAEMMHEELDSHRLEVVLVPSPVAYWPTNNQRRVVCERNPAWYRQLCAQYSSGRRKPRKKKHGDTLIKRRSVLRALQEITDGKVSTEYAQRVYPYVQQQAVTMQEMHSHDLNNQSSNRTGHGGLTRNDLASPS